MTDYIILFLCAIVLISYLFDVSGKYSKIPGVIFLILLGIGLQLFTRASSVRIPNLEPLLPVFGSLGLIMIVMEASLDLKLERAKKRLITKSVFSAFLLFAFFSAIAGFILFRFFNMSWRDSLLNVIPLGIISSSVAIPAASYLGRPDREFVVYESSFSDIFGILAFDFILLSTGTLGEKIVHAALNSILTLVIAFIVTVALAYLLHKTRYHVNYVIIMTSLVLVYTLAKIFHLPALLLVLIFGLVLSNNRLYRNTKLIRFIDFDKFETDITSFKKILTELTFLVRSFFFIMFGFYTKIEGLLDWHNVITGLAVVAVILILRLLFFKFLIRMPLNPLLFFSPRGLITILLFLSIPLESRSPLIGEETITIIILLSILLMMFGNLFSGKKTNQKIPENSSAVPAEPEGSKN